MTRFTVPNHIRQNAIKGLDFIHITEIHIPTDLSTNAKNLSKGIVTEELLVHMESYFLRHESELDSKKSLSYNRGETSLMSTEQVVWLLCGGSIDKEDRMKAYHWAKENVDTLENQKKFASAQELIRRKNILRDTNWKVRTEKFRTKQSRDIHYEEFDKLLGNWDFALAKTYYVLLRNQVNAINKVFAEQSPVASGTVNIANIEIDNEANKWIDDVADIYESMAVDFAYLQTAFLLPEEKATDDDFVYSPSQQERITRNRRLKPRKEIIEDGFYPRRRAGVRLPIERQTFNRASKDFVQKRLDTLIPDMSKTMKKNLNTALRKATDEVAELGLTGARAERHIQKRISKTLGKKNLGRAMNIARTEGTAIANYGMAQSAGQTGLMLTKEWTTKRDGRVRDAHIYMDRIEVDKNDTFNVQGYEMKYPADTSYGAPPRLVCRCRCVVIYHERRI